MMTPFVEDGVIQQPVYIYRVSVQDMRDNGLGEMFVYKDFLTRRIEDDDYIPECFFFEADYIDGFYRLIARPYQFNAFWLDPADDDYDYEGDETYG